MKKVKIMSTDEFVTGTFAFDSCVNLKSAGPIGSGCDVEFAMQNPKDEFFEYFNYLESIIFPDNITAIEGKFGKLSLKTVSIPDTVTRIGDETFSGSKNLTEIKWPNSLQSIGDGAFSDCGFYSVTIPDTVTSIGDKAFSGSKNLTEIKWPNSLQSIGDGAFSDCGFYSVTIPEGVNYLGYNAFSRNYNLTSVEVSSNVKIINIGTFNSCTNLSKVVLKSPDTISIKDGAFNKCKIYSAGPIGSGCSIEYAAKNSITGLNSIGRLKELIIDDCFTSFESIKAAKITIGGGMKTLTSDLLNYNCDAESITIRNGVETIKYDALHNVKRGCIISIPKSVSHIESLAIRGEKCEVFIYGRNVTIDRTAFWSDAIIHGYPGSTAETFAKNNSVTFIPLSNAINPDSVTINSVSGDGISANIEMPSERDLTGMEYSWWATNDNGASWICAQDWKLEDTSLSWKPSKYGNYTLVGKARYSGDSSSETQYAVSFDYHPYIAGTCQMPYSGEGGGYLIGVAARDSLPQGYTCELLVLDCNKYLQGLPAWIYQSGKCDFYNGGMWTVWQPEYGYFWTLFRIYDTNGEIVDEVCYGFANI